MPWPAATAVGRAVAPTGCSGWAAAGRASQAMQGCYLPRASPAAAGRQVLPRAGAAGLRAAVQLCSSTDF